MRAFFPLLFVLSACGSAASPPSPPVAPSLGPSPAGTASTPTSSQVQEPTLRPVENATCVIRTENVALVDSLPLSYGGKEFAAVQRARRLELRATRGAATMEVSTEHYAAIGEVQLEDVLVGPRSSHAAQPHEGWLTVWRARAKSVANDALTLEATLPTFVTPAAPLAITYPCNELTFQPEVEPSSYDFRYLKRGTKIPLRLAPRGPIVAWLESPSNEPAEQVAELERKGRVVRIAIPDADVLVQGWVDASALSPKWVPSADLVGGILVAPPNPSAGGTSVQCSADVPFYVRTDDSTSAMRVGSIRGSTIIHRRPANERGEVPIDLGLDAASLPPPLQPFVRAAAIAGCIEAPGR